MDNFNSISHLSIDNTAVECINKSTMATELELNHIDHKKIYSAIKQIRELKSYAGVNSIHKEIVKVFAD